MNKLSEKRNRLVLCDEEEEYARLMTEFLRGHRDLPWEIHTYTSVDKLMMSEQKERISLLVIAESAYREELQTLDLLRLVILNESGVVRWDQWKQVDKYQQAENVLRELLEIYMEVAGDTFPRMTVESRTRFVGIYSPVRRCLQTSFAITMSQMLAGKHRTLYMNFAHYAGITEILPDEQTRDLADLLYFLSAPQDRFKLRLQTMIQQKGSLDYIPPMKAGQNLLTITGQEWLRLLGNISELGGYEYVVLDLTESMQGLFDILRMCARVFTLTREDRISQCKLTQYEQVLALCHYEDVLDKTRKCRLPQIRRLPEELEQYTKGELADYVQAQLQEI